MASTASATASSAWVGSKKMLVDMAVTRRVIGGRVRGSDEFAFPLLDDDDGEG